MVQDDGYWIDLVSRMGEAVENYGKKVAIRYWTATIKQSDEKIKEGAIREILGALTAEFEANHYSYSEWTSGTDYDVEFKVGKHNLYSELMSFKDKYLILEVDFLEQ